MTTIIACKDCGTVYDTTQTHTHSCPHCEFCGNKQMRHGHDGELVETRTDWYRRLDI